MVLVFDSLLLDTIVIVVSITVGFAIHFKFSFQYWKKRNVPELLKPWPIFGNLLETSWAYVYSGIYIKKQYDIGKSQGYKHSGYYVWTMPVYVPFDVKCIKNILQKDFDYFTERGFYYNERDDPISANLFALGGEKWKILRAKLTPAYTSKKLKEVFHTLLQCTYQLQDAIEQNCERKLCVDLKEVSECFIIDAIGSCAFGLECNSFKNPEAEFKKQGNKIFSLTFFQIMKAIFSFSYVRLARWLKISLYDKESNAFFINVVKNSLKHREGNSIDQKNFLQLLLNLGSDDNKDKNKTTLTTEELAAQVFIFFAAGFETSSITLTFCLYELAINQNIQKQLREEINSILKEYDGNITYDAIMDMRYLNRVVKETLRKYPPVSFTTRVPVRDYRIPDTESIIGKEALVYIPILALHHDPDFYPDPDKFDPERFSDENSQKRNPFTYLPFGEGPRICIGLRFGLMQIKMGLVILLKHYNFSLNEKTKLPLQMKPLSFTLTPKNKIYLNVDKVV